MSKYVIIGNSAAAIGCVEGIRSVDKAGEITIVSNEKYHTYSRPLISYLLWGKTDLDRMKYRPDDFYKKNGVQTILGVSVVKINKEEKTLSLDNGEEISYEKLLVATGSKPFVPPMDGMDKIAKKFSFMSLDDAFALDKELTDESKVLIVGAGLIGLKCAEGIRHKVGSITVVDLADRILPSVLDEEGSKMVQKHIEDNGVEFFLSDSVKKFSANSAELASGAKVDFDVAVLCVGVRPNTELISDIGGEVNKGIIVDDSCMTSIEDVYAAGDCTESYDITIDKSRILALLPNAYMQGETAGISMAGGDASYNNAIPMNAGGFFGLHITTAGSYVGDSYVEQSKEGYKKLFYQDNVLKGFIIIGDISRAGIYTSLIREKTPLDTIDFELIKKQPQLMAFSAKERAEKLGGQK